MATQIKKKRKAGLEKEILITEQKELLFYQFVPFFFSHFYLSFICSSFYNDTYD